MKKFAQWPHARPEGFTGNPHTYYGIACKCGALDYTPSNNPKIDSHDPAGIRQAFEKAGWTKVATGRGVCPSCAHKTPKGPKEMTSLAAAAERSPAALKALPELYMMLGDYYDAELKCYKAGWSDDKIAKDLKLAPEFVSARRASDFGPLVVRADPLKAIRVQAENARLIAQRLVNVPLGELAAKLVEFNQHMNGLTDLINTAEKTKA